MKARLLVELHRLVREAAFRGALLVILAASIAALVLGARRVATDRDLAQTLARDEAARYRALEEQLRTGEHPHGTWSDPRNPGTVALSTGIRSATLPPGSLGAVAVGQRDVMPTAVGISLRLDPFADRHEQLENPRVVALGALDLGFVIVTLLPLLVFALGFDLVSGDRERGTLHLILSQRVKLSSVVVARTVVRGGAFGTVAVLLVVAGAVSGSAPWSGETVADVLVMAVVCLVYGAFWFGVVLAIQRLRRSSQTNALLALGVWLTTVVVLPAVLETGIEIAAPLPPRATLFEASREAQRDATRNEDKALAAYYGDHPQLGAGSEDAAVQFWKHFVIRTREADRELRPVLEDFDRRLGEQQALVESISAVTPAASASLAISELAGTGTQRHRLFAVQVREYARRYRAFFESRALDGAQLTAADITNVPRFEFREEPPSERLSRVLRKLAEMLGATVLLFAFAFARFDRSRWIDRTS